jgi:biotin operon repressor
MSDTSETVTTRDRVLDQVFRPGSSARKIAEILLDGMPHSRADLADAAGVSPTTVPRVVKTLRREGVPVEASLEGRSAVYTVGEHAAVRSGGVVTAFSARGNQIEVETASGSYSFRFNADGTLTARTPRSSLTID